MSQSKFTASERADKCVLPLDLAVYQTTKRERGLALIGQIQKILATAQTVMDGEK